MPPAAPEPIMTKSTSSAVLYFGCSGLMISFCPRPPDLAASLDSPCRNIQTAVGTCARHRGRSLSSPRHPDCRVYRNRGQSENRKWYPRVLFQKKFAPQRWHVTVALCLQWAVRPGMRGLRLAASKRGQKISPRRGTFRGLWLATRASPPYTVFD